ncbi:hypothetical protein AVEN_272805-1 [Araneus ventricosus]|uniref:Retroviral polymerase SH3-like domain-containing protein n=1 Tax=Araneus ventricosus TaxID=182803 RepID=A0A4Y2H9I6_ARAVE|nr:hypothetical protein AVEN_272805-1 [Araneus ventricosus]
MMVGYALQTKGYRICLPVELRIIETINVSFGNKMYKEDNDRSRIEVDPKIKGIFSYTSPQTPEYEESDTSSLDSSSEKESFPVSKVSISTISTQTELEQYHTDREQTDDEIEGLSGFYWIRKAETRKNADRIDIYYYFLVQKIRLRSINEVKKYCEDNEL